MNFEKRGDEEHQRKKALAEEAVRELMERGSFDGLVVIASWQTENGMTATVSEMRGNWYAQNGMMQFLLEKRRRLAELEAESQVRETEE